jgi:NADH dehydrogenase (ubiquinone) Fe-S protein 1
VGRPYYLTTRHADNSALSEVVGSPLPYDDVHQMRDRMWDVSPTLVRYDSREAPSPEVLKTGLTALANAKTAAASSNPLKKPISDFYRTDPISRASVTMASCSKAFTKKDYDIAAVDESGNAQASYA